MRWLRRAEIALWVVGLSCLGGALATVVDARVYQARQGRAFSDLELGKSAETPGRGSSDIDPRVLGLIEIPRIGVSAIVREGDDEGTLAVAVGHIPGTARPGERGNMALAGHRDSFFRELRNVQVDDSIHIRTASGRYEYRVDSTEVVGSGETRVLGPTDDAVLTLVTCFPFGYVGHAPDRFIVRASQVSP